MLKTLAKVGGIPSICRYPFVVISAFHFSHRNYAIYNTFGLSAIILRGLAKSCTLLILSFSVWFSLGKEVVISKSYSYIFLPLTLMEPKGFWQGSAIIWEGKVSKVSSDAIIASYGEEGSWNFTFRRNLNVREIGRVASSLNPSKVLIAMRTPLFGSHGAKDQVHRKYNLSRHLCYISRGVGELHFPRSQS